MEKQFFEWKEWDQMDTMAFYFYNVTLTRDLAPDLPAGTKAAGAFMDYGNGLLQLDFDKNAEDYRVFELAIHPTQEITETVKLRREAEDSALAEMADQRVQDRQKDAPK